MDNKPPTTNKQTEPATPINAANPVNPFPHFDKLQRSINAYWDELAGYENAMYERARTTTADMAGLAKDSIAYAAALTEEWRRMSLEATRRMTAAFSAKG
jgi:hypothetical protein